MNTLIKYNYQPVTLCTPNHNYSNTQMTVTNVTYMQDRQITSPGMYAMLMINNLQ